MRWTRLLMPLVCGPLSVLTGCSRNTPPPEVAEAALDRCIDGLSPRDVRPSHLRWLDIAGTPYAPSFRDDRFYHHTGRSRVRLQWVSSGPTFTGVLTATRLKPNFAYQMKLFGRSPVASRETVPDRQRGPLDWASYQLGRLGRWSAGPARTNLVTERAKGSDAGDGTAAGYILFDSFITDSHGNARKPFALDSSYHVLWREGRRTRHRTDGRIVRHAVMQGSWGYCQEPTVDAGTVGVFAEKEEPRPRPGHIVLPEGAYDVLLNITEESFHDNQKQPREYGGLWAEVLEEEVSFTVER